MSSHDATAPQVEVGVTHAVHGSSSSRDETRTQAELSVPTFVLCCVAPSVNVSVLPDGTLTRRTSTVVPVGQLHPGTDKVQLITSRAGESVIPASTSSGPKRILACIMVTGGGMAVADSNRVRGRRHTTILRTGLAVQKARHANLDRRLRSWRSQLEFCLDTILCEEPSQGAAPGEDGRSQRRVVRRRKEPRLEKMTWDPVKPDACSHEDHVLKHGER